MPVIPYNKQTFWLLGCMYSRPSVTKCDKQYTRASVRILSTIRMY